MSRRTWIIVTLALATAAAVVVVRSRTGPAQVPAAARAAAPAAQPAGVVSAEPSAGQPRSHPKASEALETIAAVTPRPLTTELPQLEIPQPEPVWTVEVVRGDEVDEVHYQNRHARREVD